MTKNLITYMMCALCAICILSLPSCKTNDGDIGPYYGIWSLNEITADGVPTTDCDYDQFFFKFQADIVIITETMGNNDFRYTYGTWHAYDHILSLNFTHHSTDDPSGESPAFSPATELHIPSQAITDMTVETITSKELEMEYTSESGVVYHYSLKKHN